MLKSLHCLKSPLMAPHGPTTHIVWTPAMLRSPLSQTASYRPQILRHTQLPAVIASFIVVLIYFAWSRNSLFINPCDNNRFENTMKPGMEHVYLQLNFLTTRHAIACMVITIIGVSHRVRVTGTYCPTHDRSDFWNAGRARGEQGEVGINGKLFHRIGRGVLVACV